MIKSNFSSISLKPFSRSPFWGSLAGSLSITFLSFWGRFSRQPLHFLIKITVTLLLKNQDQDQEKIAVTLLIKALDNTFKRSVNNSHLYSLTNSVTNKYILQKGYRVNMVRGFVMVSLPKWVFGVDRKKCKIL